MLKYYDYDNIAHSEIDGWAECGDRQYKRILDKYALFGERLSDIAKRYKENKLGNIKDFIKVVETDGNIIAFLIINVSEIDNNTLQAGINPIVVNPHYTRQGYGRMIIADFMAMAEKIIGLPINELFAAIDVENIASVRLFENAEFVKSGESEDGRYGYYVYKIIG